jgi:hypothetical protein
VFVSTTSPYKQATLDMSKLSSSSSRQAIRNWNSQKEFRLSLLFL